MTNDMPKALRLADELDHGWDLPEHAAELRRLHAANMDCVDHFNALKADYDRQQAVMRQALEALESCHPGDYTTGHVIHPSYDEQAVDAAITALREALEQPIKE